MRIDRSRMRFCMCFLRKNANLNRTRRTRHGACRLVTGRVRLVSVTIFPAKITILRNAHKNTLSFLYSAIQNSGGRFCNASEPGSQHTAAASPLDSYAFRSYQWLVRKVFWIQSLLFRRCETNAFEARGLC